MTGIWGFRSILHVVQSHLYTPYAAGRSTYRPDIDGLRAVAIISVVGFHIGVPGFGGGFIGVDVFFVISGFLITTLLLDEVRQRGSIDLPAFFARRARRLLPAFFLVTAVTLVLGFFFLVPVGDQQQRLAHSAMAAALYVSNLHFGWAQDNYFDPEVSLSPLLHTWSLAVEEQFYLIWPLIVLGAAWAASRWRCALTFVVAGILGFVLVASLSYAWWATQSGPLVAKAAFFVLPARAWELGMGASLALALPAVPRSGGWSGSLLTVIGFVAIAAAVVIFHEGMVLPGTAALLPTLGAAAIIAGVWLAPNSTTAKLLSGPALVFLGLLSYSWYLWHWPLLAIARAHALGMEDLWRDGAIAVVALGLAGLTYIFVEQPIRSRRFGIGWSNLKVLGAGAAASLLIIAAAQGIYVNANHLLSLEPFRRLQLAAEDEGWSVKRCQHRHRKFVALIPRSECMHPKLPGRKLLVVWGDSHANNWIGTLEEAASAGGFALLPRWMGGCPPLLGIVPITGSTPRHGCKSFNNAVSAEIEELQQEERLVGVVLSARWQAHQGDKAERLPDEEAPLTADLRSTLEFLAAREIKVLIIASIPEQDFRPPECLAMHSLEFCSISRDLAESRRHLSLRAIHKAVALTKDALVWDPLPALCDDRACLAEREGILIYRDTHHLTYSGSRRLAPYLRSRATWLADIASENSTFRSDGGMATHFAPSRVN